MLIPMYLLIGSGQSKRRVYAAVKFFIYPMWERAHARRHSGLYFHLRACPSI